MSNYNITQKIRSGTGPRDGQLNSNHSPWGTHTGPTMRASEQQTSNPSLRGTHTGPSMRLGQLLPGKSIVRLLILAGCCLLANAKPAQVSRTTSLSLESNGVFTVKNPYITYEYNGEEITGATIHLRKGVPTTDEKMQHLLGTIIKCYFEDNMTLDDEHYKHDKDMKCKFLKSTMIIETDANIDDLPFTVGGMVRLKDSEAEATATVQDDTVSEQARGLPITGVHVGATVKMPYTIGALTLPKDHKVVVVKTTTKYIAIRYNNANEIQVPRIDWRYYFDPKVRVTVRIHGEDKTFDQDELISVFQRKFNFETLTAACANLKITPTSTIPARVNSEAPIMAALTPLTTARGIAQYQVDDGELAKSNDVVSSANELENLKKLSVASKRLAAREDKREIELANLKGKHVTVKRTEEDKVEILCPSKNVISVTMDEWRKYFELFHVIPENEKTCDSVNVLTKAFKKLKAQNPNYQKNVVAALQVFLSGKLEAAIQVALKKKRSPESVVVTGNSASPYLKNTIFAKLDNMDPKVEAQCPCRGKKLICAICEKTGKNCSFFMRMNLKAVGKMRVQPTAGAKHVTRQSRRDRKELDTRRSDSRARARKTCTVKDGEGNTVSFIDRYKRRASAPGKSIQEDVARALHNKKAADPTDKKQKKIAKIRQTANRRRGNVNPAKRQNLTTRRQRSGALTGDVGRRRRLLTGFEKLVEEVREACAAAGNPWE